MKRILSVLLTVGGLTLAWMGTLNFLPTPRDAKWIDTLYTKKEAAARRIAEPKIVLIGGSSVHFGISAEEMSKATGWPVVNLGSHAGLGAHYILDRAKRSLKSGDIALLALEAELLNRTWSPTDVLADYVGFVDSGYLVRASTTDAGRLLFGVNPVAAYRLVKERNIGAGPLYRGDALTENGDETVNRPEAVDSFMRNAVKNSYPVKARTLTATDFVVLHNFVAWAKSQGIQVFIGWSPLVERTVYAEPRYERQFAQMAEFYAASGAVVVGTARDYMLPAQAMMDTGFHPTTEGARRVTRKVAENLRRFIAGKEPDGASVAFSPP